jgi:hypothetical protein
MGKRINAWEAHTPLASPWEGRPSTNGGKRINGCHGVKDRICRLKVRGSTRNTRILTDRLSSYGFFTLSRPRR